MVVKDIVKYINNEKSVDLNSLKARFKITDSQMSVLIPILSGYGINYEKIDKVTPVCAACPVKQNCNMKGLNKCGL
ncbi:MAG TPA: hypothetical protein PLS66_04415 [Tepiditoga sp.]|jgi:hypothetical protein|nr:hypothetical protein [Thermotogota bacterium]HOO74515.1 hypothetical protein [Tepiditoga sp.]